MRVASLIALLWMTVLKAQQPEGPAPAAPPEAKSEAGAVLENTGRPIRIAFNCTSEDIQTAGMTCTQDEPCPVYLEMSAVGAIANRIVAAGNIHSAESTLYSVVVASEDDGRTWREPYQRLRGSGFDHVQLLDLARGWISGGLLQPLPRDPFFLITGDGGKSWREQPVFNEGGSGAIQQFWFDSPAEGALLMDRMQSSDSSRYELYESPNGGDTWIIRQGSSSPITPKHQPSNPVWRIRADAATKSYRIEHIESGKWKSVASFLVPLGSCRPQALAPPAEEPPPETPDAPASLNPPPRKPPTLQRPGVR